MGIWEDKKKSMKNNNQSTNFDDYLKSKLQDKEIKEEYDKLEPEFTAIGKSIESDIESEDK